MIVFFLLTSIAIEADLVKTEPKTFETGECDFCQKKMA
jgi:hypothetical protein